MRSIVSLSLLAFAPVFVGGCYSPSIREGVWTMRFSGQDSQTGEPVDVPSRLVRVEVQEGSEGEDLKMTALPSGDKPSEMPPIYGLIPWNGTVKIRGEDGSWRFLLLGRRQDEENLNGQFESHNRLRGGIIIKGMWEMSWTGDSPE